MAKRETVPPITGARAGSGSLQIAVRLRDWSPWCREVIRGVQEFAHARPDWRLYVDTRPVNRPVSRGGEQRETRVWDGIITGVLDDVAGWKKLVKAGRTKVVAVTAGIPAELIKVPRVRVDDAKVAESICRHLFAGGFRRLAYYSTPRATVIDARLDAVRAIAEARGWPFDSLASDYRKSANFNLARLGRWVERLPKPVGILTWSMSYAREVVDACRIAGVKMPEEVAVVAWDDDALLAETGEPTISGAVLPSQRLGHEAARLLDELMQGKAAPEEPVVLEPSGVIHVRQSSDASALKDRPVHLALQYIREHAAEPFKIPQLAKVLCVSRRKLENDFLRVTGQTPLEAITLARIERAKQLLVETGWPVRVVAERSGFGTVRRLHQVFAIREKTTPAEYRGRFGAI